MITVCVHPTALLTANQRLGRWPTIKRTKSLRELAFYEAKHQHQIPYLRAHLIVDIEWPNRRRRDEHNLMPTIKPLIDGMVDANVLPDDDHKHLTGPDLRAASSFCDKAYACRLTFRFLPPLEETA